MGQAFSEETEGCDSDQLCTCEGVALNSTTIQTEMRLGGDSYKQGLLGNEKKMLNSLQNFISVIRMTIRN